MKRFRLLIYTVVLATVFASCSSEARDVIIKKDLAAKAKAEIDFAGVRFNINQGIVTLNGTCATRSALDAVYNTVCNLYGVKNVVNNLRIGEVVIGKDWLLKRSVDSVLTDYAQVEAITKDSIVTLYGKVDKAKRQKLLLTMKGLQPARLELQLSDTVVSETSNP